MEPTTKRLDRRMRTGDGERALDDAGRGRDDASPTSGEGLDSISAQLVIRPF